MGEQWKGTILDAIYLGYDQIAVIERSIVEIDEDIVVTEFGYISMVIELEAIKAILARDGPLLVGGRCHFRDQCENSTWSEKMNLMRSHMEGE